MGSGSAFNDGAMSCTRCESLVHRIAQLEAENARLRGISTLLVTKESSDGGAIEVATLSPPHHCETSSVAKKTDHIEYTTPLSRSEMQRYSRQMLVPDFRVLRQLRLRQARVLIIGAGGLGCPAALYLGGMGVGTIGIVDNDHVERSNLHRQIGHDESTIGLLKVKSLARRVRALNPDVQVDTHAVLFSKTNAADLVCGYDVVLDASDNPSTRYLVNDTCALQRKPLISGSALGLEGQVTVFTYEPGTACYRCMYPTAPRQPQSCEENGVLGVVPGIIGCLQALEAVKVLTEMGSSSSGSQLLFDAYDSQFRRVKIPKSRRQDCPSCGPAASEGELASSTNSAVSVSSHIKEESALAAAHRIPVAEFARLRRQERHEPHTPKSYVLLDTRAAHQFEMVHFPEAINVPFDQLRREHAKGRLAEFVRSTVATAQVEGGSMSDRTAKTLVLCRRGVDSILVTSWLLECGLSEVYNIDGGYTLYADEHEGVDQSFPMY